MAFRRKAVLFAFLGMFFLVINTITSPKRAFMRQESKLAKLCASHATQGLTLFHGLYPRQASLYPVFPSAPIWKRLPQPSWAFLKYAPFFDPADEYVGFKKACLLLRQGT